MSQNIKQIVGANIKKYRQQNNLSQQELAQKLHCERSLIAKLERGSANCSLERIEGFAIQLGVGIHQLIPNEVIRL